MRSAALAWQPAVELSAFVERAARAVGAAGEPAVSLAAALLALPAGGSAAVPWTTRSGLNHDGTPLEICLSGVAGGCRARLICDPAAHLSDPEERSRASRTALDRALPLTAARELTPLVTRTLDALLPAPGESLDDYVDGVLWLGGGLGQPGLAVYVDVTRGPLAARFDRVAGWWERVLPDAGPALAALARLQPAALPMAAGVEGTAPANARAKLFFRLQRPLPLADLGLPAFMHPRLQAFLAECLGARTIALKGLVLSLSFAAASGEPSEAKIDLCGHCLGLDPAGWVGLTASLAAASGLTAPPLEDLLGSGVAEVAYIGLARHAVGAERLDLFLMPGAPGGAAAFAGHG